MAKGWLNLEAATDAQMFTEDSAFSFLGLTRTQRIYGFVGWYVGSKARAYHTKGLIMLLLHIASPLASFSRCWEPCSCLLACWPASQVRRRQRPLNAFHLLNTADRSLFSAVLYAMGTVISLVGTGFLIGVSPPLAKAGVVSVTAANADLKTRVCFPRLVPHAVRQPT